MNDMVTPSVSLEGKSLWIPQSMPVKAKTVLRAKIMVQLILTGIPMLFAAVCGAAIVPGSAAVKAVIIVMPLAFVVFSAAVGMAIGIRMPLLNWTNESAPIKQSGAIAIILFGSWGVCVAVAGLYLFIGYRIGAVLYLAGWAAVFAVISLILIRWLNTRGADTFAEL